MHGKSAQPATFAVKMKTSIFHRIILVMLLSGFMVMQQGCIFGHRTSKQVRKAEKESDRMAKEQQAEFDKAYKDHLNRQSNLTKQQMKDMKKRQRKANRKRQRSLWDRIFNNKCDGAGITM
jgi:Mg2+/citrate symporter